MLMERHSVISHLVVKGREQRSCRYSDGREGILASVTEVKARGSDNLGILIAMVAGWQSDFGFSH